MSEYHKIQSLFLRDPATNFKTFLEGQYSCPEFAYLEDTQWELTEKVDGTNVRVYWNALTGVIYEGRTKDAQMPTHLLNALRSHFDNADWPKHFPDCEGVTLYGEGYGAKIQKGGGDYRQDQGFILFDVNINGIWLNRADVFDIAAKMQIPAVPAVGFCNLRQAVAMCKDGFESQLRKTAPEGVVLRPVVELRTRRGDRIITKLKLKDFQSAEARKG